MCSETAPPSFSLTQAFLLLFLTKSPVTSLESTPGARGGGGGRGLAPPAPAPLRFRLGRQGTCGWMHARLFCWHCLITSHTSPSSGACMHVKERPPQNIHTPDSTTIPRTNTHERNNKQSLAIWDTRESPEKPLHRRADAHAAYVNCLSFAPHNEFLCVFVPWSLCCRLSARLSPPPPYAAHVPSWVFLSHTLIPIHIHTCTCLMPHQAADGLLGHDAGAVGHAEPQEPPARLPRTSVRDRSKSLNERGVYVCASTRGEERRMEGCVYLLHPPLNIRTYTHTAPMHAHTYIHTNEKGRGVPGAVGALPRARLRLLRRRPPRERLGREQDRGGAGAGGRRGMYVYVYNILYVCDDDACDPAGLGTGRSLAFARVVCSAVLAHVSHHFKSPSLLHMTKTGRPPGAALHPRGAHGQGVGPLLERGGALDHGLGRRGQHPPGSCACVLCGRSRNEGCGCCAVLDASSTKLGFYWLFVHSHDGRFGPPPTPSTTRRRTRRRWAAALGCGTRTWRRDRTGMDR